MLSRPKLTDRQQQILDLIERAIARTGAPPTRAEIASELGFQSANAAEKHFQAPAPKRATCVSLTMATAFTTGCAKAGWALAARTSPSSRRASWLSGSAKPIRRWLGTVSRLWSLLRPATLSNRRIPGLQRNLPRPWTGSEPRPDKAIWRGWTKALPPTTAGSNP